jgi:hypothetical protein
VLEHDHQDAVRRRNREQVEHDRLGRDDKRAEGDEHECEREQQDERNHDREL